MSCIYQSYASCPDSVSLSVQVTELFVDSKSKLEQCTADLDEKQQRWVIILQDVQGEVWVFFAQLFLLIQETNMQPFLGYKPLFRVCVH